MKTDDKTEEESCLKLITDKDNDGVLCGNNVNEVKALTVVGGDEDTDMLADVKQMAAAAAAAAAGQASSSFENQLRPIDRYAMHFLDLWDPIIDKSAIENEVKVNEEEWELDRIEKFMEDLEAEIDEDQEPFFYERWDADFATKAYREHVEALAQQQYLEGQEYEAQEAEEALRNEESVVRKPKLKKKQKKTKFKSLKKGTLSSETNASPEELLIESNEDALSPEDICMETPPQSPRKKKKKESTN